MNSLNQAGPRHDATEENPENTPPSCTKQKRDAKEPEGREESDMGHGENKSELLRREPAVSIT